MPTEKDRLGPDTVSFIPSYGAFYPSRCCHRASAASNGQGQRSEDHKLAKDWVSVFRCVDSGVQYGPRAPGVQQTGLPSGIKKHVAHRMLSKLNGLGFTCEVILDLKNVGVRFSPRKLAPQGTVIRAAFDGTKPLECFETRGVEVAAIICLETMMWSIR